MARPERVLLTAQQEAQQVVPGIGAEAETTLEMEATAEMVEQAVLGE